MQIEDKSLKSVIQLTSLVIILIGIIGFGYYWCIKAHPTTGELDFSLISFVVCAVFGLGGLFGAKFFSRDGFWLYCKV